MGFLQTRSRRLRLVSFAITQNAPLTYRYQDAPDHLGHGGQDLPRRPSGGDCRVRGLRSVYRCCRYVPFASPFSLKLTSSSYAKALEERSRFSLYGIRRRMHFCYNATLVNTFESQTAALIILSLFPFQAVARQGELLSFRTPCTRLTQDVQVSRMLGL